MSEGTTRTGGCHCKRVRYAATGDFDSAMSCNCSMCGKKGTMLSFIPAASFTLKSGEGDLTDYQFNKHKIHHTFCKVCGVTSFARGVGPNGQEMIAINVRCLDDVDLDAVKVKAVDGKSF